MKRTLITVIAVLIGIGFLWGLVRTKSINTTDNGGGEPIVTQPVTEEAETGTEDASDPSSAESSESATADSAATSEQTEPVGQDPETAESTDPVDGETAEAVEEEPALTTQTGGFNDLPLAAKGAAEQQDEVVLGSAVLDPDANPYMIEAKISPWGAGIRDVLLSRYTTEPRGDEPYRIQERQELIPYAMRYIYIKRPADTDWEIVELFNARFQVIEFATDPETQTQTARLGVDIVNASGERIISIIRDIQLAPGRYDVTIRQSFVNFTEETLDLRLEQYGPGDMPFQATYLGDRRSFHMGYFKPEWDPNRRHVSAESGYRGDLTSRTLPLWIAGHQADKELIWVGVSNRYFSSTVFLPVDGKYEDGRPEIRSFEAQFPSVRVRTVQDGNQLHPFILLDGREMRLEAGEKANLDISVYTGPKSPDVIDTDPVYDALGLHNLIIYNIGGMCTFCTFAWLAEGLLWFLKLIFSVVGDWGVAIIILVAVVRSLLHPITKRSQLNMMRFGKQMAQLQPEMERLKKKYGDNQQKLNQEMMRLYKEKGVNPAAMGLGCLPMFLQMPIWIALYAMLFFAIELRHEAAFYGIFQSISNGQWEFLGDLAAPDRFLSFDTGFTMPFVGWYVDSLNLLPLLMIGIFWLQQKYTMTASAVQSDQARQQQKIMKFMMLLFPIFLYPAPSGLNLYILASTTVGIIESKRVRAQIQREEEEGKFDLANKGSGEKNATSRKRVQNQSRKSK